MMTMKLGLNTSKTNTLKLTVSENTDITTAFVKIVGLPIESITCSDPKKAIDFNGSNVIIYATNKADGQIPIANGDTLTIVFTVPKPYGSYPITLTPQNASTKDAVLGTVSKVSDGLIAMTFSQADLVATVAHIIGKGTTGINVDGDGDIDSVDVQLIINNIA